MKTFTLRSCKITGQFLNLSVLIASMFCVVIGQAATYTWTGNSDTNWTSNANWNLGGGYPSTTNDSAFFTNTPPTANQPFISANVCFSNLVFTSGGWKLSGASSAVLTNFGVNITSANCTNTIAIPIATYSPGFASTYWWATNGSTLVLTPATANTPVIGGAFGNSGNLHWGDINNHGGTLLIAGNIANGQNVTLNLDAGSVIVSNSGVGYLASKGATINGGTFLVQQLTGTSLFYTGNNNGAGSLNGGVFNLNGFNDTLYSLTLNGGTLRNSGGIVALSNPNAGSTMANFILATTNNVTLGDPSDTGVMTFKATTTSTTNGLFFLSGAAQRNLIIQSAVNVNLPVANTNSLAGLTIAGVGQLTLSATNTYNGLTVVKSGTLLVNGSTASAVTNLSGATFGGTGVVSNDVSFASGAVALFTNGAPLTINGNLILNSNTVKLNLANSVAAGTYTLATFTGSVSGSFAATPTLNSGSIANGSTPGIAISGQNVVLTVSKVTPTATLTLSAPTSVTYNGSAQTATVVTNSSSVPGIVGNIKYNGSATVPIAAGVYTVTADFIPNDTVNYNTLTGHSAGTFTINVATPIVTPVWTGGSSFTYIGSGQGPTLASVSTSPASTGTTNVQYVGTGTTSYGPSANTPTNAGTYQVTATISSDANNNSATSSAYNFTINPAASTINLTGTSFTYTGAGQTPAISIIGSSGASTTNYTGTGYANASAPTNVGNYTLTVTVASDANHMAATNNQAYSINVATPIVTPVWAGGGSFTYNAGGQGPTLSSVTTSPASTGTTNVQYSGRDTTSYGPSANTPTNAGTYQVSATIGSDANNNSATSSAYNFTISPAASTVGFTGTSFTYTGAGQTPAINVIGSTGACTTNYTGIGYASANAPTNVGNYTLTVSVLSDINYNGTTNSQAFTINIATPIVTPVWAGGNSFTYNAGGQGPTLSSVTTSPASTGATNAQYAGTGTTSYGPSVNMPTNAGSYQVTATVGSDANNNSAISSVYNFTINPAATTITLTGSSFNYNGAAQGPVISISGSAGACTTNYTGIGYASANAPTNTGSYTLAVTVASDINYNGTTNSQAFIINAAALTVTANSTNKFFDGIPFSGGSGVTYAGFVNGETNTVLSGTLAYGGSAQGATNVGVYTIIPSGLNSTNYTISYVNGTLTINSNATVGDWAWSTSPSTANWNANNWTIGATPGTGTGQPGSGSALYFGTSSQLNLNNDLSGFSFAGITFNSGANAFTFTGNAFTLTGGITNNSSSLEAITNNIALGAATMVTNTAAGKIYLGGVISGANNLTLAGTGTDTLAGANTYSGSTTLGGSVNDQITVILGNKNAFGGSAVSTETLNNGVGSVTLQAATDLSGANAITNKFTLNVASGVTASSFNILGANNLTLAGPFSAGYNMFFSNGLTGGATLTLSSNITVTGRNINFNGSGNTTISGNIVAASGIFFNGTGTTTIGGTNGNTSLFRLTTGGPVVLGTTQSVGTSLATLQFWTGNPTLQASADLSAGLNIGGLLFNTKSTFSGANNITFNCSVTNNNASGSTLTNNISFGKTLGFAGPFYLSSGTGTSLTFVLAGTGNTTFSGPIANGPITLANFVISNTATTTMSGANTYNGNTTISTGTLALSGNGSLSNSPVISLAGGTTFDVSGLSSSFVLQPGQTISNSSTSMVTLAGNIDASQGAIAMTANGTGPAFIVTSGTLILSANTILQINNSISGAGMYPLITNGVGGSVGGTAPTNTFSIAHTTGSFVITNGALNLLVVTNYAAPNYYVATTGSDLAGDGSLANPWQSITKARDALENLSLTNNVNVNLRGGRYFITNTITFTTADSGVNGYYITYQSYPGETAIIDGGQQVTGWTQVSGKSYWVANVSTNAGFANYFRQLYVNGVRAVRAHSDWINGADYIWTNGASFNYSTASTGLTNVFGIAFATNSGLKNYSNVNDLRLFDVWHFKEFEIPVISITTNSGKINLQLQQPYCQYSYNTSYGGGTFFQATGAWMIINAFEELNEPGEWYLNRATQQVFYYPSSFENMSNAIVYAPVVEDLMNLSGDSVSNKLQNLRFQNLTFEHGNWFFPRDYFIGGTEGESLLNAAQPTDSPTILGYKYNVPGAIRLTNTVGIQFVGNIILHQATCGINTIAAARDTLIQGNIFYDLTGAAVINYYSGYSGRAELCTNTVVADNVIRNTGADFMQSTLVNNLGGYTFQVIRNDMADCQYDGVIQTMPASSFTNYSCNANTNDGCGSTLIVSNRIKLAMVGQRYEVQDGGYIYNSGVCPSCLIANNDLDGLNVLPTMVDGWINGFYQDFDSYGLNWSNNVIRNCNTTSLACNWVRADGCDPLNCVQYNTYTDCTNRQSGITYLAKFSGYYVITTNGTWPGGSTPITNGIWPAGAQAIMQNAGVGPTYTNLLSQIYSGDNLARGKYTWASSSNTMSQAAVDWDYTTVWHSAPSDTNSWWAVDLGAPYVIQRLELVPNTATNESAARCNFQVQGANDTNFTSYTVLAEQNSTPFAYKQINLLNSWIKYINNTNGCRYLRVQKTSDTSLGIAELQAYGYPASALTTNGFLSNVFTKQINQVLVPTNPVTMTWKVTNKTLMLSWPSNYIGWVLQVQTNALAQGLTTNWGTVTGSSLVTATNLPIYATNAAVFYRLMYQP